MVKPSVIGSQSQGKLRCECVFLFFSYIRTLKLSKPKLNQQLSSTEFEVRLHSYIEIHPPHTNSLCCCCAAQLAGRDLCVQLYSHRPVQALCTTIDSSNVPHTQHNYCQPKINKKQMVFTSSKLT